jgi:cytochrome b subunit of formate dehydrogenase
MIWLAQHRSNAMAKLIRIPLIINFVLLVALLGPGSSRELYNAGKRAGVTTPIMLTLQVWVLGSTLFVTGLIAWRLLSRQGLRLAKLDWALFAAWWAVLIAACLFAFSIGMGG